MSQADVADLDAIIGRAMRAGWKPPPKLKLSAWADLNFVLSAQTAAEPGRWHTLPYQREILDSITEKGVVQVTIMKSARVGYTLCMTAAIGYFMHHEPTSILVVQPTVDDAKHFSKESIAPMLRDVPVLAALVCSDVEDWSATLTHKTFPGGILSLIGANSGTGFRRVSRRVVMFDEVDAYPPSAGPEGDPVALGIKRSEGFRSRKIIAGSTPLIAGTSRIAQMFEEGDQRHYYVPCPQCGAMDFLAFREGTRGHFLAWDDGKPETAHFVCRANGCVIEHKDKRWMVEHGEWRPDKPGGSHRSYHLWSALSYAPNATWEHVVAAYLAAQKASSDQMKTFHNTWLGETWQERGEAPDWEQLYRRRENYPIGSVPAGALVVTTGVDVHKDRFVYEVVAWSAHKESWSVEAGVLLGDTADEATWGQLDALLLRSFQGDGRTWQIAALGIDSGYDTQRVYDWARRYPMTRVMATKGMKAERALLGVPSPVDVTIRGRVTRGYRIWPVGVDIAKAELYGWLRLPAPLNGEAPPAGYCHFPELGEEFFKQLTAEHLVTTRNKRGFTVLEWQVIPGRENHWLDCRVLARAAASMLGIDRIAVAPRPAAPAPVPAEPAVPARAEAPPPAAPPAPAAPAAESLARPDPWKQPRPGGGGWLQGGRPGGWLGRRR